MDNEDLVRRAKKGDSAAFGELYSLYANELYRYALYCLGSSSDAEDAVQDATVAAWKNLPKLRNEAAFRAWFFRILANRCKKMLKNRYVTVPIEDIDEPSEAAPRTEEMLTAEAALAKLGDTERLIVLLSVIGGYNSKETGAILGKKPSTVRSVLSRSLEKLRGMTE